ncbi:MAG: TraR/DksA family transcriptional regulator [Candidatus Omnitrophota bacterium]
MPKKKPEVKKKREKAIKAPAAKSKSKIKGLPHKDLKVFKEKLLNIKEDLVYQIRETSEETLMKSQKELSGDISGYTLHIADMASDNYARDFNLHIVSTERRALFEIDEALKRIDDKNYGICLSCNKLITRTRLKAIPHARYCTKCQSKLENENRI